MTATPRFLPCTAAHTADLVAWLSGDDWPFHGAGRPSPDLVDRWVAQGRFFGPSARSFWVEVQHERVGFLSLQELTDPTPVFDLRLRSAWRGRGLGRIAVRWLAEHVFSETTKHRVEAHTRRDNVAMRRVLRACGWVKEAHHRRAWPDDRGGWHDAITYALLRDDWAQGTSTPVPWDEEP